jgi:DNA-binding IclR family transcriptional regulator
MEGLRAVAAGVEDNQGVAQGAIGVIGPAFMYPDSRMEEIAPAIKNCAQIVSLELSSTNQRIPREAASAGFSLRELRPLK